MSAEEIAAFLKCKRGEVDAQKIQPYIRLIIVMAQRQARQAGAVFDLKARLLVLEHLTVHAFGMSEQDYSFALFKDAEQVLEGF